MQIFSESKVIEKVVEVYPDLELRKLLATHVERLKEFDDYSLDQLVRFVVMEHNDTVADLDATLGFPIMTNRFDGVRFGEPSFNPSWEAIEEHINWFELVYVLSDDGFGVVVFVPKHADPELLGMLQQYSRQ